MTISFPKDNCWRENKNRFLFSFLSALVELDVFEEISCNFLLVGHTGNEVDQLFREAIKISILISFIKTIIFKNLNTSCCDS